MATRKAVTQPVKLTITQARKKIEDLEAKLDKYENTAHCPMCGKHKDVETKFYYDTDPLLGGGSFSRICRDCAKKIALRVDENGEEHTPTRESVQKALYYLNKPFLETVWNASIQESENLVTGKTKNNVWTSYIKNIQMINYVGMGYMDSDMFKKKVVYEDEKQQLENITEESLMEAHVGIDTYDSFLKNKNDVIRLLSYDPFEKEDIVDQPFLYSQLLGILDSSEDANEDMMRTSSAISIVRGFLQQSKIDDTVAKLMSDISNIERNSATIKSLQESKGKITSVITSLAQDSCISLKHNKNAKKGENTWTGKIKKIKDLNLREGEVNGFDLETCKAMKQVMDLSNASIMKTLALDESEWSDMVAEQRQKIVDLQRDLDKYIEISRILLRENLDIKDCLKDKNIKLDMNFVDLNDLFSCFSEQESDEDSSESEGKDDEV